MLKISENKLTPKAVTLRLEGRIVGPWVEELKQACEPLVKSGGCKLVLDLADVSFADEQGLTLLSSLKARGIKLLNPAPFVEEQLKSATSS
jgi:anti-anti-sigma regulatory factor